MNPYDEFIKIVAERIAKAVEVHVDDLRAIASGGAIRPLQTRPIDAAGGEFVLPASRPALHETASSLHKRGDPVHQTDESFREWGRSLQAALQARGFTRGASTGTVRWPIRGRSQSHMRKILRERRSRWTYSIHRFNQIRYVDPVVRSDVP